MGFVFVLRRNYEKAWRYHNISNSRGVKRVTSDSLKKEFQLIAASIRRGNYHQYKLVRTCEISFYYRYTSKTWNHGFQFHLTGRRPRPDNWQRDRILFKIRFAGLLGVSHPKPLELSEEYLFFTGREASISNQGSKVSCTPSSDPSLRSQAPPPPPAYGSHPRLAKVIKSQQRFAFFTLRGSKSLLWCKLFPSYFVSFPSCLPRRLRARLDRQPALGLFKARALELSAMLSDFSGKLSNLALST